MILLSHPAANASVHHIARALNRAGVLGEFWTCFGERKSRVLLRVPPDLIRSPLETAITSTSYGGSGFPFVDLIQPDSRMSTQRPRTGKLKSDAMYRSLDREMSARIEDEKFRGVYAFEDNAAETFRAAGRRGLLRVYDVPHGHWRAAHSILEEEAELSPEWARSTNRTHDVAREHARKDAELEQADLIFAASSFTMRTLEQVPELSGSVGMIPHGGPLISDELFEWSPLARNSDRLRVLYVGDLNQRMGLSYLFRACHDLRGAVDLTVIGTRPPDGCAALDRELREVTWRPNSSQEQIQAEMAAHDVFVLPALFDGSGQTLVEAMAMGLPVIATENSAAPDVIDDGVEGFIIPVRSSDSIVENLDLLRREPDRRVEMSANAARRARLHTWENYERLLAASVATALACH